MFSDSDAKLSSRNFRSKGSASLNTDPKGRPDMPLALVTGGGGISLAAARRLGRSHRIVLASDSASKNVARLATLLEDGVDAVAAECDMTDPVSVAALKKFVAVHGPLRTLVHVAALSPTMGDWRDLFAVNLVGSALVEQACLELVTAGSAAVFVASSAGYLAAPPVPEVVAVLDDPLAPDFLARLDALVEPEERTSLHAYRLSKFALRRMCRFRATAWGVKGARIVSMSPGSIATPMGARELTGPNREVKLDLMRKLPIQRVGTMAETADAIEFLVSDRASYITGTDLLVDGGLVAGTRPDLSLA